MREKWPQLMSKLPYLGGGGPAVEGGHAPRAHVNLKTQIGRRIGSESPISKQQRIGYQACMHGGAGRHCTGWDVRVGIPPPSPKNEKFCFCFWVPVRLGRSTQLPAGHRSVGLACSARPVPHHAEPGRRRPRCCPRRRSQSSRPMACRGWEERGRGGELVMTSESQAPLS